MYGLESNSRPVDHKSDALTTTPPSHRTVSVTPVLVGDLDAVKPELGRLTDCKVCTYFSVLESLTLCSNAFVALVKLFTAFHR